MCGTQISWDLGYEKFPNKFLTFRWLAHLFHIRIRIYCARLAKQFY